MPLSRSGRTFTVFVSSTSEDLKDHRAVARNVILDQNWKPEMMEHFGALASASVEACYEKLRGSDLMLLIIAFRRGWVPAPEQGGDGVNSVTALELAYARKNNIPVLILMANDSWPRRHSETQEEPIKWIDKFRSEVNQPAVFFEWEEPSADSAKNLPIFRSKAREILVQHHERLLAQQASVPASDEDTYESARETIQSGQYIPFLGAEIHGQGSLSTASLTSALGGAVPGDSSLAALAEYRQHVVRGRSGFLKRFGDILNEQAARARPPAVYDLLIEHKPPLIVSATSDLLLERRLEGAGKRVIVVSHVIRSLNGAHDGKVVVFQGVDDRNPSIRPVDGVELRSDAETFVIYKPLGSPILHRNLDAAAEIDTVVITESDHLALLGRLENPATGIPTAFSRAFQRCPLLFFGYPLDVWHYRLVMQVFKAVRPTSRSARSLAVRVATTQMEAMAWDWLDVDVLAMDSGKFAARMQAAAA